MRPTSGVIYQDHQANSGAAKYIEGIESLIQATWFVFKNNE